MTGAPFYFRWASILESCLKPLNTVISESVSSSFLFWPHSLECGQSLLSNMTRHLERMPSINEDDPFNCSVSTINRSVSTTFSFDSSQNISPRSFLFDSSQSRAPIFRYGSSQITSPSPQSNSPGIPNFYAQRDVATPNADSPGIPNFYFQREIQREIYSPGISPGIPNFYFQREISSPGISPGIPNFYIQREISSPGVFDFDNLRDADPHSSDSEFEEDRNAKRR